jgi:hypothetical protein
MSVLMMLKVLFQRWALIHRKLIIYRRNDILVNDGSWALKSAAINGHGTSLTTIIEHESLNLLTSWC